ncbi:MAG: DNA internalization-related competence protein ComEC/Rec2, partial [Bacillota bacterium]
EVYEVYENYIIVKSNHRYLVYIEDSEGLKPGSIIKIYGEYKYYDSYNIIHNFDYKTYLKSKNIIAIIESNKVIKLRNKFNIRIIRHNIKNYLEDNYNSVSNYLKMFIIGEKNDLDSEILEKSNKIGISHLFAISGMHLALIVLFLNKLINLFYFKKETYNMIIYLFIIGYIIITGFSISIIRAGLLTLSLIYIKNKRLLFSRSDLLTFSFLFLVIINPYTIYNIGFQFSYLIAFSLLLIKTNITNKDRLLQFFKIGVIANLFSLPIILEMNKEFGIMNIFVNVIFIILVGYILLPGAFIVLLMPNIAYLYKYFLINFEYLVYYIEKYNYYISFNFSNSLFKFLYWLLLILVIIFLNSKKKYYFLTAIITFVFIAGNFRYIPKTSFVRILDVNQGDAIHLFDNGCNILIDTGNEDKYNHLINYFLGSNIRNIDKLILTHKHKDHYGEIDDIISNLKIKELYVNKYYKDVSYKKQKVLKEGDIVKCKNIKLLVLNSNNNLTNENNNSIVLYGKIGNEYWLFTSDIEEKIEIALINKYNIKVDHLKVSHHGSFSSNSKIFLENIKPENAYISVGNNKYGLPDSRIINRLKDLNINIHITNKNGSITVYYFYDWQFLEYYIDRKRLFKI